VRSGAVPAGSAVSSWLLNSCTLALDHTSRALDDFSYLRRYCRVVRQACRRGCPDATASQRVESSTRSTRHALWQRTPDALATLLRTLGGANLGFGRSSCS